MYWYGHDRLIGNARTLLRSFNWLLTRVIQTIHPNIKIISRFSVNLSWTRHANWFVRKFYVDSGTVLAKGVFSAAWWWFNFDFADCTHSLSFVSTAVGRGPIRAIVTIVSIGMYANKLWQILCLTVTYVGQIASLFVL